LLFVGSISLPVLVRTGIVHALDPGGDTAVVDPGTGEPISILENGREPESPNIRLVIPAIEESDDCDYYIIITSVTGGTLKDAWGGPIDLGEDGTKLFTQCNGYVDFWFTPSANRNTDASFTYELSHYDSESDSYDTASESTVTIPITPVDVAPTLTTANGWTGTGLTGTYYRTDYNLTGDYSTRVDPVINFDTSVSGACGATVWSMENMCPDNFSVRWTGQVKAPVDGDYTFATTSDDGVRLWVDGVPLIDNWTTHGPTQDIGASTVHFVAGSTHDIELDFYERGGGELIDLQWTPDAENQGLQDIPTENLFPGTIRPELTYVVGSPGVPADDGLAINDVDSTTMSSATVKITKNFKSGEDILQFTNQNGISGSYNATTGVMTLSGTASIADYQAALRSVKYNNASPDPDTSTRTLEFMVNDGEKDSNITTRDIAFSTENSPPEILQGASANVTMDEDSDPTPFSLALDANDPNFDPVSWSISTQATHGTASVDGSGNSVAINYTPSLHYTGSDNFEVQVSDGNGGTDTITVHVTIQPFVDNDGIDTATEDAAPNSGDANNDGTLDSKQSNVAAFLNATTGHYTAVAVDDTCTLSDTTTQSLEELDSEDGEYIYPLGLASFSADCGTSGFTTTVKQYYYDPPAGNFVVRKFVNGSFQDIPDATIEKQTIGGHIALVITYQIKDGGPLDDDGLENGTIVDPAGPALQQVAADQSGGGSSGSASDAHDQLANTGAILLVPVLLAAGLTGTALFVHRRNPTRIN
jgi:hypothetical protein